MYNKIPSYQDHGQKILRQDDYHYRRFLPHGSETMNEARIRKSTLIYHFQIAKFWLYFKHMILHRLLIMICY